MWRAFEASIFGKGFLLGKTGFRLQETKPAGTPRRWARLRAANLVIFAGPREMFSSDEFTAIKDSHSAEPHLTLSGPIRGDRFPKREGSR